ncbi:MAG: hypothetical protein ACLUE1_07090 [Adlercreutzia equolifaciens]
MSAMMLLARRRAHGRWLAANGWAALWGGAAVRCELYDSATRTQMAARGHQRHDRLGLGAAGRSRGRSSSPSAALSRRHAANYPSCGIGGLGGGQRGHAPGHGGRPPPAWLN